MRASLVQQQGCKAGRRIENEGYRQESDDIGKINSAARLEQVKTEDSQKGHDRAQGGCEQDCNQRRRATRFRRVW